MSVGERYTVVYAGHPSDARILNGERAPGVAVRVSLGDTASDLDALKVENARLRAALPLLKLIVAESNGLSAKIDSKDEKGLKALVKSGWLKRSDCFGGFNYYSLTEKLTTALSERSR